MSDFIQWMVDALKGGSSPTVTTNLAPPLASYPSSSDADYARKYGYSEGNENQSFLDNQSMKLLGHNYTVSGQSDLFPKNNKKTQTLATPQQNIFIPESGEGKSLTELTQPGNGQTINPQDPAYSDLKGNLNNRMMQAALAANRIPIAGLGFDPNQVTVDALLKHPDVGGVYNPNTDNVYTNTDGPDSIVHESIHRGLQKLRELYPDQTKTLLDGNHSPDEELIVRHLMQEQAGDPEGKRGAYANADNAQREQGMWAYNKSYLSSDYNDSLKQLQELAIDAMKNRGKRAGPQ
jgi:hypothetical protein